MFILIDKMRTNIPVVVLFTILTLAVIYMYMITKHERSNTVRFINQQNHYNFTADSIISEDSLYLEYESIPVTGHRIPKGIKFHLFGLSDIDHRSIFGWDMKTLSSIRTLLNHDLKVLDILKIDIEGDEWKAIPQILASVSNKFIKQIVIEIHFGRRTKGLKGDGFMSYMQNNWGDTSLFAQLDTLKQLEHHGFKTFRSLKNPRAKLQLKYSYETFVFTAHVVSLKNTNIQTQ